MSGAAPAWAVPAGSIPGTAPHDQSYAGSYQQPYAGTYQQPWADPGAAQPYAAPGPAQRRPGLADRLRTPVAGALLGGVVILGAGFAAGYVVGHDRASSASTNSPGGQFGQFGQFGQGGPGGQFGQTGPGGQTGQTFPGQQNGQLFPGGPDDQNDDSTGSLGIPGGSATSTN